MSNKFNSINTFTVVREGAANILGAGRFPRERWGHLTLVSSDLPYLAYSTLFQSSFIDESVLNCLISLKMNTYNGIECNTGKHMLFLSCI